MTQTETGGNMTDNRKIVQSIKQVVEFLEANPTFQVSAPSLYTWAADKADFLRHCKILGTFKKSWDNGLCFKATRDFGNGVDIRLMVDREEICERTETTTVIPEKTLPAVEAMTIPEHEKVTVEWKCPEDLSLMAERESRKKETA
jgi:hypothetical protein